MESYQNKKSGIEGFIRANVNVFNNNEMLKQVQHDVKFDMTAHTRRHVTLNLFQGLIFFKTILSLNVDLHIDNNEMLK